MPGNKQIHSLRHTVIVVLGVSLIFFTFFFVFIVRRIIPGMMGQVENGYLTEQFKIVNGLFSLARQNAVSLSGDMALWEDTARFLRGGNPGFITDNWANVSPEETYHVNYIIIKDREGRDRYTGTYDFRDRELSVPPGFSESLNGFARSVLDRYRPDLPEEDLGDSGIFFYRDRAYFFSVMPVVSSVSPEDPAGTLFFVYVLDNVFFQSITYYDAVRFEVFSGALSGGEVLFEWSDAGLISVTHYVQNPDGTPLRDTAGLGVFIRMNAPRTIYTQTERNLNRAALSMVVFFILLALILYGITGQYFLLPLERLSRDVYKITTASRIDLDSYSSSRELQTLCTSINDMLEKLNQSTISTNVFKSIFNGMEAYLIVSDPGTDEILFINSSMKAHYGLDNRAIGRRCWEVLQKGMTGRCPFCPLHTLAGDPSGIVVWEEHSALTGRYYKNTSRMIDWGDNTVALLQHSTDISDLKAAEVSLQKRLGQQELMSAISQSFISPQEMSILINNALGMTGDFMNVSKTALARLNPETNTLEYEYDWQNEKHALPSLKKRGEPFSPGGIAFDSFILQEASYIACNDINENPDIARLLPPLGIKAFINVPVTVYGSFWGVLTIDECTAPRSWDEGDIQLVKMIASAIAGVIIRNNTEEQLLRMSSIVNSAPQYISYITTSGQFKYFNQGALKISGYSREELTENNMSILFRDKTNAFISEEYIPKVLEEGICETELPLVRKDGAERTLSVTAFTIGASRDGIGVMALDITEKRELERELITAKEQAEQSNLAKSNFLARMSHEMRTPMNAIIGMTTIAQSSRDQEKMEYCLSKINEASIHLLGVINDILDMSKIEAGKFELSYSEFDFEKMLQRVTNVMNFRLDEKKQNFIIRIDHHVPRSIIADEQRLAQVLTNLLSNAGKFTPEAGSIALAVKKLADRGDLCTLRIEVADTGIGISPEQQGRLFSLFEQADGSIARKYGGTGLGLAISKSIVELMGGEIWVESELGRGSTFVFEITVERGKDQGEKPAGARWEKLRILAVDDSPEVLDYFLDFAESMGIHCTTAAGGAEAYELLEASAENPFDLVFTDWRMPGMNGIELTKKIKQNIGRHIVVIMISAAEWSVIENEAKEAGVDGFIPKPLFPSVIVDCINTRLGAIQPETSRTGEDRETRDNIFTGFRVLLAEDVEINREIVLTLLEDTGIAIDCAENGSEVLGQFRQNPSAYDLILMDIHMPEMDGFEATRKIRALDVPEAKTIPIVAMTANVFREDIEKCLAAGMNDHIGKPIDIEVLMEKLRQFLPEKGTPI
jgi:PAS domain S-box-containing protein